MTTLKQGDTIKDRGGITREVLGVCGKVVHISSSTDKNSFNSSFTEFELRRGGFTWDTPAWEPEMNNIYWFIDERGNIYNSIWNNDHTDIDRRDFLGIYQTKELAEAALSEIRRKLGK
jgi:hypothetical protein